MVNEKVEPSLMKLYSFFWGEMENLVELITTIFFPKRQGSCNLPLEFLYL